jgi:hypothetical protein
LVKNRIRLFDALVGYLDLRARSGEVRGTRALFFLFGTDAAPAAAAACSGGKLQD